MGNINVTYEEMTTAATFITTGKEEVQTTLASLRDYIQHLVNSGFVTDQASGAFNETYQDFTTNATEVIENITNLAGYLNSAADQMRATDEALAAQARG